MKKLAKNSIYAAMSLAASSVVFTAHAQMPTIVPNSPEVAAKAYILMDYATGQILAEENAYEQLNPASLTKMMTSYVIGHELKQGNIALEDEVTISENAWAKKFPDSSKMFIEVGTKVKVEDLNRGIIIQSGNDACVAMAEHIGGTEDGFVSLMNSWADKLEMHNTYFENSHGLDSENQKTTAYDMALLGTALIRDVPDEYAIYNEKSFEYNGINQYNRNRLLWDKSVNADGIKTGYTSGAGYNLVSSATKDDMRLIAVVLGTASANARNAESKKLLNYGFRFFETVTPLSAGQKLAQERVWFGDQQQVEVGSLVDTTLTIQRSQAKNLKANYELTRELTAPLAKGEEVGRIYYQIDGKDIAEFPLVSLQEINEGSLMNKLMDYFKQLFAQWFG